MRKTRANLSIGAIAIAASMLLASSVEAQWSGSIYGSAEADTRDGNMLFAGMSMSPAGGDVVPTLGLQGYRLSYGSGSGRTTVYAVKPSAGLSFRFSGGSANANLGYAFTNKDVPGSTVGTSGDQGEGIVLAGGLNLRPSGSTWAWEGLGSYNFGSESFWGRLGASTRIRETSTGSWHVAPQISFLNGIGYSAIQPAVMLNWHANQGLSWGAGLGYSIPGNNGEQALVFKLTAGHSLF